MSINSKGAILGGGFGIFSVILAFIIFLNCYTTVDSGEVKVERLFGKVNEVELTEGFHIVNPLAEFTTFNTQDMTVDIMDIKIPAQDKMKTDFDVSLVLAFGGEGASDNLVNVGKQDKMISQIIMKKARSLLREVGKGVPESQDFFLDDIQSDMQSSMLSGMNEYLEPYHVNVKAVLFRDVTLPRLVREAIEQTKQRQEQVAREKQQLLVAEQKAQVQVKEAEAREKAAVSDANAAKTRADAEAYTILEKATATAKANTKIAKSLTDDLVMYETVKRWTGEYPTTMTTLGNGNAVPLIQLPAGK